MLKELIFNNLTENYLLFGKYLLKKISMDVDENIAKTLQENLKFIKYLQISRKIILWITLWKDAQKTQSILKYWCDELYNQDEYSKPKQQCFKMCI